MNNSSNNATNKVDYNQNFQGPTISSFLKSQNYQGLEFSNGPVSGYNYENLVNSNKVNSSPILNQNTFSKTVSPYHNSSISAGSLFKPADNLDNLNLQRHINTEIVHQTALHKSDTFRHVSPFEDSTRDAYGKKYYDSFTINKKNNPKIGYYGKSRLTR